jgi:transposase
VNRKGFPEGRSCDSRCWLGGGQYLKPDDIVVLDNLGSHRSDKVRQAIEAVGANSPDLNRIENAFAKLKAALRRAAERSTEALWLCIGQLVDH